MPGGAGSRAVYRAMGTVFGIGEPGEVHMHGCTDRGLSRTLFQRHAIPETEENWHRFIAGYLELLDEELARADGEVLPGIVSLIEALAVRDDVYLGLLTGNIRKGRKRSSLTMVSCGTFAMVVLATITMNGMTSRWAREVVEQELSDTFQPQRLWVIGDTPADIRCGRAIGARVVAVTTGGYRREELAASEPDWVLDELGADSPWLRELV
ncbi:MAG: HAD hydrolase-like protein [Pirellulaceae bacterium]